jgi:two-component system, OmpR family, sensor histidine kinase TctE
LKIRICLCEQSEGWDTWLKKPFSASIRNQLLGWLLLPLGTLCLLSAAATFFLAESSANAVYDEQLFSAADSVTARLRFKNKVLDVDLSPSTLAVLRHNFKDEFYYQIVAADGTFIDGDRMLSVPANLKQLHTPVFGDSTVNGEPVRTMIIQARVEDAPDMHVFVAVAETLQSRKILANRILAHTVVAQLILLVCGALAVWLGVTRGLRRLDLLKKAVAARSRSDLRPVNLEDAPLEVRPLAEAINNLLDSLREELAAKQRFVANAAHQLRTPLAGIKTYIGVLKKLETNPAAADVLKQLDAGADRTTHMVNRLLALARAEPNASTQATHKIVDLNFVASEAAASLVGEAVKKNIDLSFEAASNPALVIGDPASLQELAINLVENAVLYTPAAGTVTVSVLNGDGVELSVEDSGPGIPAPERERVFERFYRILGSGASGSGLGLSIVSEIARAHNARVVLGQGAQGLGTKAQVFFVRARPAGESGGAA